MLHGVCSKNSTVAMGSRIALPPSPLSYGDAVAGRDDEVRLFATFTSEMHAPANPKIPHPGETIC